MTPYQLSDLKEGRTLPIPASVRNIFLTNKNQKGGDIVMKHSTNLGSCNFSQYTAMNMLDTFCRLMPLKVTTINKDFNIQFYPNPIQDILTLDLTELPNDIYKITIVDIQGKVQYNGSTKPTKYTIQKTLPNGLYFLNITSKNGQANYKLQWND